MVKLFGTDTLFLRKLLFGLEGEGNKSQVEARPLGPGDGCSECMCSISCFKKRKQSTIISCSAVRVQHVAPKERDV